MQNTAKQNQQNKTILVQSPLRALG